VGAGALGVLANTTRTEASRALSPSPTLSQLVEVGGKNAGLIVSERVPLDPQSDIG
jgi:hypothetical protein